MDALQVGPDQLADAQHKGPDCPAVATARLRPNGAPDRRFRSAKRLAQVERALLARLGPRAREIELKALCRAAAVLIAATDAQAAAQARGEKVPVEEATTLASELRRVLRALGIGPDLPADEVPTGLADRSISIADIVRAR